MGNANVVDRMDPREWMRIVELPWPDEIQGAWEQRAHVEMRLHSYEKRFAPTNVDFPSRSDALRAARAREIEFENLVGPRMRRAARMLGVDETKRRWIEETEAAAIRAAKANRDDVASMKAAIRMAEDDNDDSELVSMLASDRLERNVMGAMTETDIASDALGLACLRAIRRGSKDTTHVNGLKKSLERVTACKGGAV